ncbi:MAG: cell wall-active antibiotics response protein [Cyclobacteriaceae bacterium]|nr:cell wall-active antibiotics response protein [Cyclobacteriaceae bacterium]
METNDMNKEDGRHNRIQNNTGRMLGGAVLLIIGLTFFAREAGIRFPYWLFSWPMILVAIGLYIGGRQSFRLGGWLAPLIVGLVFIGDDILEDMGLDYSHMLWPTIMVFAGLYLIFKPRQSNVYRKGDGILHADDTVDDTAIFGGSKRHIISKSFKGGEITTFFGGTDLNFGQADIQGTAVIQTSTVFGGIKLIVPQHWNLKSEVVCIFGGIDDKRMLSKEPTDPSKTLVLKGTCIFGGIDIKSY